MKLSKLQELVMDREAWCTAVPGGRKELDMTEWLNWTELYWEELNFMFTAGILIQALRRSSCAIRLTPYPSQTFPDLVKAVVKVRVWVPIYSNGSSCPREGVMCFRGKKRGVCTAEQAPGCWRRLTQKDSVGGWRLELHHGSCWFLNWSQPLCSSSDSACLW